MRQLHLRRPLLRLGQQLSLRTTSLLHLRLLLAMSLRHLRRLVTLLVLALVRPTPSQLSWMRMAFLPRHLLRRTLLRQVLMPAMLRLLIKPTHQLLLTVRWLGTLRLMRQSS